MSSIHTSDANRSKVQLAESVWREALADVLRRGFFGTAGVDVTVQDGTVQHVRLRVERVHR